MEIFDSTKNRLLNVNNITIIEVDENYKQVTVYMNDGSDVVYTFADTRKLFLFYNTLKSTLSDTQDILTVNLSDIMDDYSEIIEE